jgi:hypothetical protein
VVDSIGFNDETWLGIYGWFHSDKPHVVERLSRVGDTLRYQATVEDPEAPGTTSTNGSMMVPARSPTLLMPCSTIRNGSRPASDAALLAHPSRRGHFFLLTEEQFPARCRR